MQEPIKILYIAPDHYSFYKVILNELRKNKSYNVHFVYSNRGEAKYKNHSEKVYNFFLKTFTKRNIKTEKRKADFNKKVNKYLSYDLLFINRPDILDENQLKMITAKCKKSIVYYWDSFDKIPTQEATMKYFDKKYSFDKHDCETHNLIKTTNFFFNTQDIPKPKFDVYFIGTYDKRYFTLTKILDVLTNQNKLVHAKIFYHKKKNIKNKEHPNVTFIDEIIPFDKSYTYSQNTKILLDIQHKNQLGLSFRPYEAMGLKKKLITNNASIKNYDFYNPNNIYIWDENILEIPESFFSTPYQDIPEAIFKKYEIKAWIDNILKN